jgi:hypothetical protein
MNEWRAVLARAFDRGQGAGNVRGDLDPEAMAAFLVAAWEGIAGMGKASRDPELMASMAKIMESFLEGMRPEAIAANA